jgi:predicted Rossmann fold nucleotide-binding protein DprA/Smf involved in DNA uptake
MEYDTAIALMTLAELPQIGERRLQHAQSAAQDQGMALRDLIDSMFQPAAARPYRLPPRARLRLERDRLWHAAHCRALVARLAACGASICQPGDAPYPRRWQTHAEPVPPLAYLYGASELLRRPTASLLASRTMSESTVAGAAAVVRCAADEGVAVAVGGMKATHRIAAAMARAAGAPRLVVLDRGLFTAFGGRPEFDPFGMGPGRTRFDPTATCVLSIFRPDDHASPRNGLRRDELLAALGDIVIALSARPDGEVERICRRVLERGGRVLSWEASSPTLIAAGASAIDGAALQDGGLRRFIG